MMSAAMIQQMSYEAARSARQAGKQPLPLEKGDVAAWRRKKRCPIPNIGNMKHEDWRETDRWAVDKSGFGASYEPAMTIARFFDEAEKLEETGKALAIVEEGQFQMYVGVFVPVKHRK